MHALLLAVVVAVVALVVPPVQAQDSAGMENSCQVSAVQPAGNGLPVRSKVDKVVTLRNGQEQVVVAGTKGCAIKFEAGVVTVSMPVTTPYGVSTGDFTYAPSELTGAN